MHFKKLKTIKYFILVLGLFLIELSACTFRNDKQLDAGSGKWKLIEVYSDPGDGSGQFYPAMIDKELEFLPGNMIWSNGSLCTPGFGNQSGQTLSYDDSKILCDGNNNPLNPKFEISNGQLIIWFICYEGCAEKYEKK